MRGIFTFGFLIGIIIILGYFLTTNLTNKTNETNRSNESNKTNESNLSNSSNFLIENPPSKSLIGKMTELLGDISFESRVATMPASIKEPVDVHQGEIIKIGEKGSVTVSFDNELTLKLSDLTDLTFSQTLPSNIVLNQKDGQVNYVKTGVTPVSIRLLQSLLNIENGEVVVGIDTETHEVIINIKKGGATIGFNDIDNVSTIVSLHEGKKYLFNSDERTISLYNP